MNAPLSLQERLAALTTEYQASLPARFLEIEAAAKKWHESTPPSNENLDQLYQLAHKLAGSSSTYGFADLGNTCTALEVDCMVLLGLEVGVAPKETSTPETIMAFVEKIDELIKQANE